MNMKETITITDWLADQEGWNTKLKGEVVTTTDEAVILRVSPGEEGENDVSIPKSQIKERRPEEPPERSISDIGSDDMRVSVCGRVSDVDGEALELDDGMDVARIFPANVELDYDEGDDLEVWGTPMTIDGKVEIHAGFVEEI